MISICFVCVNYKNYKVTSDLLKSLSLQKGLGEVFEIQCCVVDNSACAFEYSALSSLKFDGINILILDPGKNLGYFQGLNFGLRLSQGEFVVICNNDLVFDKDFCRILASLKFTESVFAISPCVITNDGYRQNPHVLKPIGNIRRMQMDLYYTHYFIARCLTAILSCVRPSRRVLPVFDSGCEIHMGIGACYVLTNRFLRQFKTLSYPHFLYGEEAYFSKQIHDAGGILWYEPSLKVIHAESVSTTKIPKEEAYKFARNGYSEYRDFL